VAAGLILGKPIGIALFSRLFITELAFGEGDLAHAARVGIFGGSLVSGLAGYTVLWATRPPPREGQGK
jgi:Na+/H+ antiporter NhaA